ncbi:MAG: ankyrin repeat domain-containing protein, partial [Planctomycetota bacterium]
FSSVETLISKGADVNIRDWQSKTPLHHAVEAGKKEIVDLLLSKRAWINVKDAWGCETPLHMAARMHHRDIMQLLIFNGADVNAKKQLDDTPLLMAALAGPEQLDKHLSTEGDDVTKDTAVYLRELQKFKSLLQNDTKIDSRNLTDATPLHLTVIDEQIELAELLIANGADVNAKCKFGETPLHFAAGGGHKEIVELLLTNGADINATDYQRQSPIKWAKDKGHTEIAELLLKHGGR